MKELFRQIIKTPLSFTLIILIFSLSLTCLPSPVNASDEASSAIDDADNALRRAFEAVLDAERAGANVSGLINKLNGAGELLAEAENAYIIGNFSETIIKAEKCSVLADDITTEASNLKSSALTDAQRIFWQNLMFSFLGCAVFIVVLFFVWIWFKRVHFKRMLKMKPEVASDVEA